MLEIAFRNTGRLLGLINDLLDLSRLESDNIVYHLKNLELCNFLKESIDLNGGIATTFNVTLVLNIDIKNAWLHIDETCLHQIMSNLISKAIKFPKQDGKVSVKLSSLDNYYRIAVSDNGSGIDKAYQPFLFQKFTQEQSSQTRSVDGTGLGLAITKSLIEQLGRKLNYTTAQEDGTSFFVDLSILHTTRHAIQK